MSGRMQSGGQWYRSIAEVEGHAASSEGTALPETLDLTAGVPDWIVCDYCAHHGRSLGARRFAGMFSDGQRRTKINGRGMHHDTDIGAWECR